MDFKKKSGCHDQNCWPCRNLMPCVVGFLEDGWGERVHAPNVEHVQITNLESWTGMLSKIGETWLCSNTLYDFRFVEEEPSFKKYRILLVFCTFSQYQNSILSTHVARNQGWWCPLKKKKILIRRQEREHRSSSACCLPPIPPSFYTTATFIKLTREILSAIDSDVSALTLLDTMDLSLIIQRLHTRNLCSRTSLVHLPSHW